jgi:lipopolysaccharide/colanic/teichoic acid biosynthesis glycosyltransferase
MTKRLIDLLLSGAGMVLLSPLFLAAALLIKADSPGPVFFRQERVGRHGRCFRIHKFRTMTEGGGPDITAAGDPRITRSGRILRRWKIDELPQLWDVFTGSMSLVGPRPELPRYVGLWPPDLREAILSVRPGLTDPATLRFLDEEAVLAASPDPLRRYTEEILPAKARLQAEYARHHTLVGDVALMFRTCAALCSRRSSQGL